HKTAWRQKSREIDIGPEAQAALREFVQLDPDRFWFRPCDAVQELLATRNAERVTPRWRSHLLRNECKRTARPAKPPGEVYCTLSVGVAIRRACERARKARVN